MSTPPAEQPPGLGRAAAGAGLGCVFGAFIVPVAVFIVVLIAERFDPVCGTPGDSGGCEMGLFSDTIAAVPLGMLLGVVIGLVLALRRSGGPKP